MTPPCQVPNPPLEPVRVVLVAGPAGAGKTTLGRALAARLHLPILDLDQLTNPLLDRLTGASGGGPHWLAGADADVVRDGRYASLRAAAADIVSAGVSVVLVAPFTAELAAGQQWLKLCASVAPAEVTVLHLSGSPELRSRRLLLRGAGRDAFRGHPPEPVPAVPHTDIDAALTTQQQLFRALHALGHRSSVDPHSPVFGATFDAVLFDLDGTLVDSTTSIVRAWTRLAAEFGFDAASIQDNHGRSALSFLSRMLSPDLVPQAYARITWLESTDTDGVVALPGSRAVLAALPQAAKAIVTSGGRDVAGARIAAADLPPVDVVVTADDVTHAKPHPEPYLLAADRLGVAPERCLVVEDAPAGIAAARKAGCSVVAVGGTCDPADLDGVLWLDGLDRIRVTRRGAGYGLEPASSGGLER